MKTYIPKQPKHSRERIEAKLDARLVRQLEQYCQYLESDRDYVLSQVLELIFRKDKGFAAWLGSKAAPMPVSSPAQPAGEVGRRGLDRRPERLGIGGTA
ncbi:MAG: hypothetical protein C5B51_32335 [Terriglobia bacterium]|nr:MAG: hypothetical protein C5B51_32335 [Terriglobia bacterium]